MLKIAVTNHALIALCQRLFSSRNQINVRTVLQFDKFHMSTTFQMGPAMLVNMGIFYDFSLPYSLQGRKNPHQEASYKKANAGLLGGQDKYVFGHF